MRVTFKKAVFLIVLAVVISVTLAFYSSVVGQANDRGLKVYTYTSSGPLNHLTNTHWIETPEGVIVIDGQWVLSEAKKALQQIQQASKPIIGIFVTHPHTDHFGGLGVFAEAAREDVPIYASEITLTSMKNDSEGFIARRKQLFGADFPDQITLPNRVVRNGDEIQLGDLTFKVLDLPYNESLTTTLFYLPNYEIIFVGDFVGNKTTPILREGITGIENWIQQLEMISERYPDLKKIYPGHGAPKSARPLIEAQIEYLTTFRDLVMVELSENESITSEEKSAIVSEIETRYPEYRQAAGFSRRELLETNVDWVARELQAAN